MKAGGSLKWVLLPKDAQHQLKMHHISLGPAAYSIRHSATQLLATWHGLEVC